MTSVQPSSLFSQCIQFVAEHVDLVEDFCGFPAQIGEKIFSIVAEYQRFYTDFEYSNKALCLFSEAFGAEILEVLILSGNAVTDDGVRKMSVPFRMFQRGPCNLSTVDLSGNGGITVQCLRCLSSFPKLENVILTRRQSKQKRPAVKGWSVTKGTSGLTPEVTTQGWARPVIATWIRQNSARIKQPKIRTSLKFYNRQIPEVHADSKQDDDEDLLIATRVTEPDGQSLMDNGRLKLDNSSDKENSADIDQMMELYGSRRNEVEKSHKGFIDQLKKVDVVQNENIIFNQKSLVSDRIRGLLNMTAEVKGKVYIGGKALKPKLSNKFNGSLVVINRRVDRDMKRHPSCESSILLKTEKTHQEKKIETVQENVWKPEKTSISVNKTTKDCIHSGQNVHNCSQVPIKRKKIKILKRKLEETDEQFCESSNELMEKNNWSPKENSKRAKKTKTSFFDALDGYN
ncbi:LRC42-like protein [Mya arenaria]|uniref:LRC42-like protein n=1 Tax=Mya arenaria TaxID=6604 RepID=A0ABY7FNN9_MYAAR|nr:LRC42-like protein [Mya arenaria]